MPWGVGPWGITPWGGGSIVSLASAVAINTRTVRVGLTAPPRARTERGPGDALNPRSWVITVPATGRTFDVVRVDKRNATTFDVRVLELFEAYRVVHRVDANALRSPSDTILALPRTLDFRGVVASQHSRSAIEQLDIAQPPFDSVTQRGGVYAYTPGGDHAVEGGVPLFYKLMVRRLLTVPGGYFHLQDYGVGFAIKEPLPTSDLVVLRSEVIRQVSAEPETDGVDVELSLASDGVLTLNIRARWRGAPAVASFAMPSPFVVL